MQKLSAVTTLWLLNTILYFKFKHLWQGRNETKIIRAALLKNWLSIKQFFTLCQHQLHLQYKICLAFHSGVKDSEKYFESRLVDSWYKIIPWRRNTIFSIFRTKCFLHHYAFSFFRLLHRRQSKFQVQWSWKPIQIVQLRF